jgi:hypothetical protein
MGRGLHPDPWNILRNGEHSCGVFVPMCHILFVTSGILNKSDYRIICKYLCLKILAARIFLSAKLWPEQMFSRPTRL